MRYINLRLTYLLTYITNHAKTTSNKVTIETLVDEKR